ncbi:MAG: HD domain-containing protein [Chloroflexi bacterium]|nr:HD domain-containing protein [Chloroflexota bacterium]MBU1661879.1 HD domain-containing protein [Chloroflexota bacterium]
MNASHIRYRVRQFWIALGATRLNTSDLEPARAMLTTKQMALFTRLQASEQIHGLRVLQMLRAQGESHPDLMAAALLHDVGKCRLPLRLWERVLIVLGRRFFPERVKRWGNGTPRGWRRPFVVAEWHPRWGAEMAREAGTSPLVVYLIREHQTDLPAEALDSLEGHLLSLLQKADNQN